MKQELALWFCLLVLSISSMDYDLVNHKLSTNYFVVLTTIISFVFLTVSIWRSFR